jgi:hypothetical protein
MFRPQVNSDEGAADTRMTMVMLIRRGKITGSAGRRVQRKGCLIQPARGVRNILR